MKYSFGISDFLEEIPSLSHSVVFLYFFALIAEEVDILGISKLKWTGMGEFNSDDHYIYYCWNPSKEMEWP